MLAELRADLNRSKKKIEDLQSQNDQLVKATHKSEEKDAKVLLSPDWYFLGLFEQFKAILPVRLAQNSVFRKSCF